MLRGDIDSLGTLWDDEFIVTNPFNVVVGRTQVLQMVHEGRIAYATFERTVEAIRVSGVVGITMGQEVVVPQRETQPVTRRYTHVWLRDNESWRLAARHASLVTG